MLPCLMCWLRLLALPLQCLLPSIFLMSSFLPLQVLVWALWWLQVLWCKILMIVVFIPFCTFSTAGSGYPLGGGVLSLLCSSSCSDLRGRFPVVILLSSGSGSGKFPIERCYLWGWKSVSAVGVACPACAVLCTRARRDSQLVRAVPASTESFSWTWLVGLCYGSPFWRTAGLYSSICARGLQRQGPWWVSVGYSYWLVAACSVSGASLLQ